MPNKCKHIIRIVSDNPRVVECVDCKAKMPATQNKEYRPKFSYTKVHHGVILRRLQDGATTFLQGEDSQRFLQDIEPMDSTDYPYGPFSCLEEHLDYAISEYSVLMKGDNHAQ